MIDLADAIIKQQERHSDPTGVPEGYFIDDMGYWVELDIDSDKARYAQYLLFRILRKHNNIYMRYGRLYCGHRLLEGTIQEVLELADSPVAHVRAGQAAWIFNRLRELAPQIDENKILVTPDMFWDMKEGEFVGIDELTRFNTMR